MQLFAMDISLSLMKSPPFLQEIHQGTNQQELIQIAEYYFDGQGKAMRPMVTLLMGKAINYHIHRENR